MKEYLYKVKITYFKRVINSLYNLCMNKLRYLKSIINIKSSVLY